MLIYKRPHQHHFMFYLVKYSELHILFIEFVTLTNVFVIVYFRVKEPRVASSRYECKECGRSYKHKRHMMSHQQYECNKEPQFCCPLCPYRAKMKSGLKNHIQRKHEHSINQILTDSI